MTSDIELWNILETLGCVVLIILLVGLIVTFIYLLVSTMPLFLKFIKEIMEDE